MGQGMIESHASDTGDSPKPSRSMESLDALPVTLLSLLSNSLVLQQIAPYLSVSGILALSATCKALRELVQTAQEVFRYLDLSTLKSAVVDFSPLDSGGISWRAERMDESLTEDEFYSGPLRGTFSKLHQQHVLRHVRILILDGLSVPADLVREIIAEDRFNVRILSIREARHLNERRLQQVLRYAVRPTRAEGTPKLKGLYIFGSKDAVPKADAALSSKKRLVTVQASRGVMSSPGAQIGAEWNQRSTDTLSTILADPVDQWYASARKVHKRPLSCEWAETLQACEGIIAFDAVLCRGPRHDASTASADQYLKPAIATVALGPDGCKTCGGCPETPAVFGQHSQSCFPLLSPPPLHSPSVRAAQNPIVGSANVTPRLILRCEDCLRGRWCERCNTWWCEFCYENPTSRINLRTQMQQLETMEDLRQNGWRTAAEAGPASASGLPVKVYMGTCVEHCLYGEMMAGAGSNGMWG
ncbi:hypothetical protein LTR50_000228 [Elasticomyces elasticus]|nr:hypothetical protein LTR50_000228 [Elasticomyces elasticus]